MYGRTTLLPHVILCRRDVSLHNFKLDYDSSQERQAARSCVRLGRPSCELHAFKTSKHTIAATIERYPRAALPALCAVTLPALFQQATVRTQPPLALIAPAAPASAANLYLAHVAHVAGATVTTPAADAAPWRGRGRNGHRRQGRAQLEHRENRRVLLSALDIREKRVRQSRRLAFRAKSTQRGGLRVQTSCRARGINGQRARLARRRCFFADAASRYINPVARHVSGSGARDRFFLLEEQHASTEGRQEGLPLFARVCTKKTHVRVLARHEHIVAVGRHRHS